MAAAGAAIEVWAIHAGWSWVAAALDLLAGWSLLAAAGWAMHLTGGCRALFGLSGLCWFLATPQVAGGAVGHAAAQLGGVWLGPLATALLGLPAAVPARRFPRAVAAACWVRAIPALAGIGWLTAAAGGCLAAAALADPRRRVAALQRWPAAATGVLLGVSGLLEAVAGRGSALEHDSGALQDPRLREAILAVGRLAVLRLVRAAEAAQQAIELAESRRRLVEAEGAARQQFARDVAEGPDRALGACLAVLDDLLTAAPDGSRGEVAEALAAGQAARDELTRTAAGDVGRMLARRGLGAALLDLAAAAGAEGDVCIDREVGPGAAAAAWFAASEALTNALKHAGPARIWLTASADAGALRVEVADDGIGGADQTGPGLTGLRERLAGHGGGLRVLAGAAAGTRVIAEVPLDG
ncbi:MAG TPA: ATP-binding protein [Streptosporangiaceae bacterium]